MDKPSYPALETLCERQFALQREEAYDGLDSEIAAIRDRHNALGACVSSVTGEAVRDAVLTRFDRVMAAFDQVYLCKWRDDPRLHLTDEDVDWLTRKAGNHLNAITSRTHAECGRCAGG